MPYPLATKKRLQLLKYSLNKTQGKLTNKFDRRKGRKAIEGSYYVNDRDGNV